MYLEYFQMVDRIEEIDPVAQTIRCTARVPAESTIFEGHFPGYPLMPGTLLVETVAQSGGFLLMAMNGYRQLPVLIQVVKARIREPVLPQAVMDVDAAVQQISSGIAAVDGRIKVDGRRVAECEIRYRTMPFPQEALRRQVIDRAQDIGAPPVQDEA